VFPPAGPHLPLTLETIHEAAGSWLESRVHPGLALLPGGLDAWVAIDFAGWLNRAHGSSVGRHWDIEQEMPVYVDPELLVALLFNRRSARPDYPMVAVGVRAQSLLASTTRFRQGVEAELTRLAHQPRRAEFAAADRHLLAVAMNADGCAAITPLGFDTLAVLPDGPAVLWWTGGTRRRVEW